MQVHQKLRQQYSQINRAADHQPLRQIAWRGDFLPMAAEKCKALKPALIIGNHFGRIPDEITERYFDLYIEAAEEERRFILDMREKGLSFEEMIKGYESVYWTEERAKSQPKEAFYENTGWIIKNMK